MFNQQKKLTDLEQHEGEQMMTIFFFFFSLKVGSQIHNQSL